MGWALTTHRDVRDVVFEVFVTGHDEPEALVEGPEVTLPTQNDGLVTDVGQRFGHQRSSDASTPLVAAGHDATDAPAFGVTQNAEGSNDAVTILGPEVFGVGLEVSSVDLVVGAVLLDHEDIDAEAKQVMQLASREIGSGNDEHGAEARWPAGPRWFVPDMFSSLRAELAVPASTHF